MVSDDPKRPHAEPSEKSLQTARKIVEEHVDRQIDSIVGEIATADALDVSGLETFYVSLASESDRGLGIVLFAYVDDVLKGIYSKTLNSKVDGGLDTLLGIAGPLSSAGLRIQMAFALNWIQERTYRSLRLMQRIRNALAHKVTASGFDDSQIGALASGMWPAEEALYNSALSKPAIPRDQLTKRQLFHVRSIFSCSSLIIEMTSAPLSIRRGLPPTAPISRDFEKWSPLHQTAFLAAINASEVVLRKSAEGA